MITKTIVNFFISIFGNLISNLNLPSLPSATLQSAKDFFSTILSNASLLGLAVRPSSLKACAVVILALQAFKLFYPKAKFLLSKLPFFK